LRPKKLEARESRHALSKQTESSPHASGASEIEITVESGEFRREGLEKSWRKACVFVLWTAPGLRIPGKAPPCWPKKV